MDGSDKNWFRFGDFTIDTEEKVVRRNGERISLQPRVVEVLCILIERRGAVVSKEYLMETVWADSFVEESNITQSVYSLRRALGKDADGRDFIETVPKRGYRFVAEVHTNTDRRVLRTDPDAGNADIVPAKNKRILFALLAVSVITVLGIAAFIASRYFRVQSAPPIESVKFQKLTFSGDISFPVVSPDGRSIAFVQENSLFLQDIASGTNLKLNVPDHAKFGNIQFSNDSGSIYFRTEDSFDASGDLYQVSRFGGTPKLIAERVWSTAGSSPMSDSLAYVRFYPKEGAWTLILKDLKSGEEKILLARNLPYTLFRSGFPAWSPDGTKIAIVEQTPNQKNISRILLVNSENGEAEILSTPQFVQIEQVVWLPNGDGLVVTGRENNRFFQLWRMSLPNGEIRPLTNDLNNYRSVSISADGKNLVARQFTTFSHIWTADAGKPTELKQITFGNLNRDGSSGLSWTPSGEIIYATRITGNIDLWSLRPSDGVRRQLTDNAGTNNENPFVTRDGKYIYFESTRSGKRRIWRIDIDGRDPVQISPDDENADFLPVVSVDGEKLYYIQRNPKSNVLYRQSLIDGRRDMLTEQGKLAPGSFLTLSPDGRYLAFKSQKEGTESDTAEIVFLDLSGVDEIRTITIQTQNPGIVWADGGRSFDFVDNQPDGARIWRQGLDAKSEKRLILELPKARIFSFDWSPDARSLALARGRSENDAILLTGF